VVFYWREKFSECKIYIFVKCLLQTRRPCIHLVVYYMSNVNFTEVFIIQPLLHTFLAHLQPLYQSAMSHLNSLIHVTYLQDICMCINRRFIYVYVCACVRVKF
jgi:hypothetical protein